MLPTILRVFLSSYLKVFQFKLLAAKYTELQGYCVQFCVITLRKLCNPQELCDVVQCYAMCPKPFACILQLPTVSRVVLSSYAKKLQFKLWAELLQNIQDCKVSKGYPLRKPCNPVRSSGGVQYCAMLCNVSKIEDISKLKYVLSYLVAWLSYRFPH